MIVHFGCGASYGVLSSWHGTLRYGMACSGKALTESLSSLDDTLFHIPFYTLYKY